jgi:hypothetical protein
MVTPILEHHLSPAPPRMTMVDLHPHLLGQLQES